MSTSDQLDTLLARWAATHRLTDLEARTIRAAVLQSASADLDGDWLWGLLRPVTALLDGPNRLSETLSGLISVGA